MAKADFGFDPSLYAPVAERVRLFWESFPNGRITTRLVSRTEHEVVFEARVYRSLTDVEPAATGWAAEREGDGDVNTVACLENTETSAVGRALANLGFTAAKERPSIEEMRKAMQTRMRLGPRRSVDPSHVRKTRVAAAEAFDVYRLDIPPRQNMVSHSYANIVSDFLRLINRAERHGLRGSRAYRWRRLLVTGQIDTEQLARCERRLRAWLARHRGEA